MATFDMVGPGRAIVDYWREMLGKDEHYGPSCDHDNGLAVIAYMDALRSVCDEREGYAERLSETIQFNRQQFDAAEAKHRAVASALRARIRELGEALSEAEHALGNR